MYALVVTLSPSSATGEDLLQALSCELGLKRIRTERYLCHMADRHIERLVGRIKRSQVLVDQSLPMNGVPFDYQAHIAIRGEEPSDDHAILKLFEEKLRCSGYRCQLLVSESGGGMVPAPEFLS